MESDERGKLGRKRGLRGAVNEKGLIENCKREIQKKGVDDGRNVRETME